MFDLFLKPLEAPFVQQALAEISVLSLVVGVIGVYVVLRGLSFLSLALSHAVFPAVVVAYATGQSYLLLSLGAGIIVSLVIGLASRNRVVGNEAAIGSIYTGVFGLGVVLISAIKSRVALSEILFGRLFGVGWEDVWTGLIIGAIVLLIMWAVRKEFLLSSFDRSMAIATGVPAAALDLLFFTLMAVTVIISLPAVGNIQIIALLVTPPATARLLSNKFGTITLLSVLFALSGGFTGIFLAYHLDLVPGATVVASLTAFFLVALIASPSEGLVANWRAKRKVLAQTNQQ